MTSNQIRQKVRNDLGASFWLTNAIAKMATRDPIDALDDARTLLKFCELRYQEQRDDDSKAWILP